MKKILISVLLAAALLFTGASLQANVLVDEYENEVRREIEPEDLWIDQLRGEAPLIIDIRSQDERSDGFIPDSMHKNFGRLLFFIDDYAEKKQEFILVCQGGDRSIIAAKLLQDKGYSPVRLEGGFNDWEDAELPVDK